MNKFKMIIFILITVTASIIIGYPYIIDMINDNDTAEEITIEKGEYIVGEYIKQGIYDVEVLDGPVKFMQREMPTNSKVLGIKLNEGENIYIDKEGVVKLTPAKFKTMKLNKSRKYELNHSGFYMIESEIPSGEYRLSYTGKIEEENPLIQILSSDYDVIDSYDFKDKNNYKVKLEKGNILEVNKYLFYESESITITLKPIN